MGFFNCKFALSIRLSNQNNQLSYFSVKLFEILLLITSNELHYKNRISLFIDFTILLCTRLFLLLLIVFKIFVIAHSLMFTKQQNKVTMITYIYVAVSFFRRCNISAYASVLLICIVKAEKHSQGGGTQHTFSFGFDRFCLRAKAFTFFLRN